MTSSASAPRLAPSIVALLTVTWAVGVLALAWWRFNIGMSSWAAADSNHGREDELMQRGATVSLLATAVAVGGLVLIAVVAVVGRLPRTGMVYLGLALVLGMAALPSAARAYRIVNPSPIQAPLPGGCQEHSGGDNRCPGG